MHSQKHLLERMRKRGWTPEEIEHARLVFSENKEHHSIFHPAWDYVLHWFLFFIILVANLSVFFYMIPIIIMIHGITTYLLLVVLGLGLEAVFDIVISDLTHLEKHHHFFMAFIIPAITLVLFLLVMYYVQSNTSIGTLFVHPLTLSLTYAISVMVPYYLRIISKN